MPPLHDQVVEWEDPLVVPHHRPTLDRLVFHHLACIAALPCHEECIIPALVDLKAVPYTIDLDDPVVWR